MPESPTELDLLISTRRDLHRHPELGFQERRTAAIVAERLRAAGYEVREGVAETGVVATLRGGAGPGPTLLLRADMDALPIQEEATHDFASTAPGRMHACGHDAHVAIGLAVAERLARRRAEWSGTIRYVFQPAEEGGGGALRMVQEGVLEGADAALGLHVWMELQAGTIGVVDGPMMAGSREFRVTVRGRGGHGAIPHETVDAVMVASQLVVALQTIVSRNVSPLDTAVLTVGTIRGGDSPNIIADTAVLEGTLRAYRTELMAHMQRRLVEVAEGVGAAFGARCEVAFGKIPYPPTVNDPAMAGLVARAARAILTPDRIRTDAGVRTMAAEDFAEFCVRVPSCYFFLGIRDEAAGIVHPHHSPRFTVSEPALPVGVDVLERAALDYLAGGLEGRATGATASPT
ncbi:MAG TPA: amidohydrolase [Longimicrobium sp.]|nr:amidohydrolase [Longimicrobium sp.]